MTVLERTCTSNGSYCRNARPHSSWKYRLGQLREVGFGVLLLYFTLEQQNKANSGEINRIDVDKTIQIRTRLTRKE